MTGRLFGHYRVHRQTEALADGRFAANLASCRTNSRTTADPMNPVAPVRPTPHGFPRGGGATEFHPYPGAYHAWDVFAPKSG